MIIAAWTMPVSFGKPQWLWLMLLVPLMGALSIRSLAGLEPVRRVLAVVLRSLVVVAIALALAEIHRVRRNENLTVMFLMDRSLSVREQTDAQEAYLEAVCKKSPPDDRVGVIDFARHAYLEQLPMQGGLFLERGRLPEMPNAERTDVAAAIRLAMAMFPHDTAKRIVLMSDGNDNMGDVLGEAKRAQADGVPIDVAPLWYRLRNEIYFDKMIAPSRAEAGEVVTVRLMLSSNRSAAGTIDIYHNDRKLDLPPEAAHKTLHAGDNSLLLKVPIVEDGLQRFEARFLPDDPSMDTNVDNNQASAFTFVSGKGKVAVMSLTPSDDAALVDALVSEGINAVVLDLSESVPDLAGLLQYSAIILANTPANVFTDEQQKQLAAYVEDAGGGLIMTGGPESFGAGGWIGTPVAEILPVELEVKHKRILPRGALVIIMHSCEMPRGNMWGKLVAEKSVDTISSRDYIGVLAYAAGGESWEVPLQIAANKPAIKAAIQRMNNGDMPDFDSTMRLALQGLNQTDASQKHVIIISDGDASPASKAVLDGFINGRITCSAVGIGTGAHVFEPELRRISTATGGRFYSVRNPKQLPQIFAKEAKVVRRPLIVDDPFTPQVTFSLSELLAGVGDEGALPTLGGLILTSPKPMAQTVVSRATDDGTDPVLAHWQRGLGRVVAFTSGYWPKWGTEWTPWPKFSKLWAQIVRWTMRQEAPANFDVYTVVDGTKGRVMVEALDKNADYLNFLDLQTKLMHPDKGAMPLQFSQTGPGRYEAAFDIDQTGQYIANVAIYEQGRYLGSSHTGVSMPFSPELRELQTNEALLRQVAETTGGRWLELNPDTDAVFDHDLPASVSKQPAWEWTVAWLLLPLFLLDVAARRLASWLALSVAVEVLIITVLLFGMGVIYTTAWGVVGVILLAELVGWSIRFRYIRPLFDWITHTVTALGGRGERSTAALGKLKSVRDRVREERDAGPRPAPPPGATAEPVDPRARFDAGSSGPPRGTKDGDLREALGGAKAGDVGPDRSTPAPSGADAAGSDESLTSRLLKAKRRTQQDTNPPADGQD